MDFHIDRRIVLSQDSEFENLYKWSLQELDAEGNKIGGDQIPWVWSLYFSVTELALIDEMKIEPDYDSDDDDGNSTTREKQGIGAKLHPEEFETSYSMFGTDRPISDLALLIRPLEGEDKQGRCTVWGCPSYTSEVDFSDETIDDSVTFFLYVRAETFARYARKIAASEVDKASFRVGGVAGFYSDWSPGISTSAIKVLAAVEEHKVEIPDQCEIAPRRLGEVLEAALFLHSINNLKPAKTDTADEDDDWLDDQELPSERKESEAGGQAVQQLAVVNTRLINLLSSLRVAAWIIAALLLLILIT